MEGMRCGRRGRAELLLSSLELISLGMTSVDIHCCVVGELEAGSIRCYRRAAGRPLKLWLWTALDFGGVANSSKDCPISTWLGKLSLTKVMLRMGLIDLS